MRPAPGGSSAPFLKKASVRHRRALPIRMHKIPVRYALFQNTKVVFPSGPGRVGMRPFYNRGTQLPQATSRGLPSEKSPVSRRGRDGGASSAKRKNTRLPHFGKARHFTAGRMMVRVPPNAKNTRLSYPRKVWYLTMGWMMGLGTGGSRAGLRRGVHVHRTCTTYGSSPPEA